jgi:hypothetical protein
MDRWARAFELHKFPEIGDMKPSEMMRQMKALLPPDSNAGIYFMATFLLRLPAYMIDHIVSLKISKTATRWRNMLINCTRGGGATPSPPSMRTTIQPWPPFPVAAALRARRTTGAAARRPARGAAAGRPPGRTGTTATSVTTTSPTANRRESATLVVHGSRETGRPPTTKYSRWRHDFFTG